MAGESRWASAIHDAWMVPTPDQPSASLVHDVNGGPCLILAWTDTPHVEFYQ
ncbi:hypothetical protein Pmar_PMAR010661, partial [Perkinsus marinus ATCC 50983]